MTLSPSRVTSARRPSGVTATWLTPISGRPMVTVSVLVRVMPSTLKTDTVPAERSATRAMRSSGVKETPAAPAPASTV